MVVTANLCPISIWRTGRGERDDLDSRRGFVAGLLVCDQQEQQEERGEGTCRVQTLHRRPLKVCSQWEREGERERSERASVHLSSVHLCLDSISSTCGHFFLHKRKVPSRTAGNALAPKRSLGSSENRNIFSACSTVAGFVWVQKGARRSLSVWNILLPDLI